MPRTLIRSRIVVALATLSVVMAGALPANAQSGAAVGRDALAACVSLTDPAARLACFDKTVPAFLQTPVPSPPTMAAAPPVPPAPAVPAPTPEQLFGAERLPNEKKPGWQGEEELDAITAKVVAVSEYVKGRLQLTLDNGQVWQQTETVALRVREGSRVTIETGLFGSYNLSVTGRNGLFKMRRVK